MSKYSALAANDCRRIGKDPVLMAAVFGPVAVTVFARFVFPLLSDSMESRFAFRLADYAGFAVVFLQLIVPLLPGMMAGLLILDERDEHLIGYYAVTPLTRKGYLIYRLFLPSLLCLALFVLFFAGSGIAAAQFENVYTIALLGLEAPCFALFLAAYAANKVEGLALSKVSGLLFAGPVIAYFAPARWQLFGAWIPTYWPARCYLSGLAGEHPAALGCFAAGFLFHAVLLCAMMRAFMRRID